MENAILITVGAILTGILVSAITALKEWVTIKSKNKKWREVIANPTERIGEVKIAYKELYDYYCRKGSYVMAAYYQAQRAKYTKDPDDLIEIMGMYENGIGLHRDIKKALMIAYHLEHNCNYGKFYTIYEQKREYDTARLRLPHSGIENYTAKDIYDMIMEDVMRIRL